MNTIILDLIPAGYTRSGDSIRFTTNGFQQYYIKVKEIDIDVHISEYEDWDNRYLVELYEDQIEKYHPNAFRIHKIISIEKK